MRLRWRSPQVDLSRDPAGLRRLGGSRADIHHPGQRNTRKGERPRPLRPVAEDATRRRGLLR